MCQVLFSALQKGKELETKSLLPWNLPFSEEESE